jgi:hypothetical protein
MSQYRAEFVSDKFLDGNLKIRHSNSTQVRVELENCHFGWHRRIYGYVDFYRRLHVPNEEHKWVGSVETSKIWQHNSMLIGELLPFFFGPPQKDIVSEIQKFIRNVCRDEHFQYGLTLSETMYIKKELQTQYDMIAQAKQLIDYAETKNIPRLEMQLIRAEQELKRFDILGIKKLVWTI